MSYGDPCEYCDHDHCDHEDDSGIDGPCLQEGCDCNDYWFTDDEDDDDDDGEEPDEDEDDGYTDPEDE